MSNDQRQHRTCPEHGNQTYYTNASTLLVWPDCVEFSLPGSKRKIGVPGPPARTARPNRRFSISQFLGKWLQDRSKTDFRGDIFHRNWRIEIVSWFHREGWWSGDTTPCKVTPVILHGDVSPEVGMYAAREERCPPRQTSSVERLKATVEPPLIFVY